MQTLPVIKKIGRTSFLIAKALFLSFWLIFVTILLPRLIIETLIWGGGLIHDISTVFTLKYLGLTGMFLAHIGVTTLMILIIIKIVKELKGIYETIRETKQIL